MPSRAFASIPAVVLLGAAMLATSVSAQSLGDLARREAERREGLTSVARVITNRDVPRVAVPAASSAPSPTGPSAGAPVVSTAPAPEPSRSAPLADRSGHKAAGPDTNPADWVGRLRSLAERRDRDQIYLDALRSRIQALTNDVASRDDPAQRATLANDREKALAELGRLEKTLVGTVKAIADLEEEARRAGVPPGWLR